MAAVEGSAGGATPKGSDPGHQQTGVAPRSHALIDIGVVSVVCATYVTLEVGHVPKRWIILAMGLALAVYGGYLAKRRTDSWHDFGFRTDNLKAGLLPAVVLTAVGAAGLIAFGMWQGRTWGADALLLLALYPAWALAQQFAFQGILHRRLMELVRSPILQLLVTAAAFASVHIGNTMLVALTLVAGVAWSLLYRRHPNLWLLAGSHSVLAALAYPLVLGDAPLARF